ncbi:MAG: ABC transporter permease [Bacillota bacterium]|nr:ABC transporter permease [Bacillota bacterium]
MKKWLNIKNNLPAPLFLLCLIAAWEVITATLSIPEYILPSPSAIAAALNENFALLVEHSRVTMVAVLGGLILAIAVALILALAMDRWRLLKRAFYPILVISQAVPIFALAPILLIWFGAGLLPKVLIVTLVCFFPLAVNLVEGFSQVNPETVDLMRTMQADRWLIMRSVQFPSAMPYFFTGLKIAATYSVMGAIIGEWLAARAGLGIYMLRAMHSFRTSHLFAAIIVVVFLSLALFKLVEAGGWLAMPWQRKVTENLKE